MDFRYAFGGRVVLVQVEVIADGYAVTVGGRTYQVKAQAGPMGELDLEIDGDQRCRAFVAADGSRRWVAVASGADAGDAGGHVFVLTVPELSRPRHAPVGRPEPLQAQMPGIVRRVLVAEGQLVARGQALVLLEAMKMEIRITAPEAGVVRRVAVKEAQSVERGQALVELTALPD